MNKTQKQTVVPGVDEKKIRTRKKIRSEERKGCKGTKKEGEKTRRKGCKGDDESKRVGK